MMTAEQITELVRSATASDPERVQIKVPDIAIKAAFLSRKGASAHGGAWSNLPVSAEKIYLVGAREGKRDILLIFWIYDGPYRAGSEYSAKYEKAEIPLQRAIKELPGIAALLAQAKAPDTKSSSKDLISEFTEEERASLGYW